MSRYARLFESSYCRLARSGRCLGNRNATQELSSGQMDTLQPTLEMFWTLVFILVRLACVRAAVWPHAVATRRRAHNAEMMCVCVSGSGYSNTNSNLEIGAVQHLIGSSTKWLREKQNSRRRLTLPLRREAAAQRFIQAVS